VYQLVWTAKRTRDDCKTVAPCGLVLALAMLLNVYPLKADTTYTFTYASGVGTPSDGNGVRRTGKSMGERVLRDLQWEAARRILERRDFLEAQVVIEQWRVEYNTRRPHSALGYRPPAPAAYLGPSKRKVAQGVASSAQWGGTPEFRHLHWFGPPPNSTGIGAGCHRRSLYRAHADT
jgi:hypothetical protein